MVLVDSGKLLPVFIMAKRTAKPLAHSHKKPCKSCSTPASTHSISTAGTTPPSDPIEDFTSQTEDDPIKSDTGSIEEIIDSKKQLGNLFLLDCDFKVDPKFILRGAQM